VDKKTSITWISIVGIIGILFGIYYSFFGLSGFPAYNALVPNEVIIPWSNGLYGSVFIGFSVLLLLVGRQAIQTNDTKLKKSLLYGIYSWLFVEAAYSIFYAVYFNIAVDILLAIVLGYPLIKSPRTSSKDK
jgi:hypothetical protein